jgi:hypothetical protein
MKGKDGGRFAAVKYARRQNINLKLYAGKNLMKSLDASLPQQNHCFRSLKASSWWGGPEVSAKQQKEAMGLDRHRHRRGLGKHS